MKRLAALLLLLLAILATPPVRRGIEATLLLSDLAGHPLLTPTVTRHKKLDGAFYDTVALGIGHG